MKTIFLITCLFIASAASSQAVVSTHIDYSIKYQTGGGIDVGYNMHKSYLGVNTLIYFTNKRDVPVYVNFQYGYLIRKIMPFISYGHYTAGAEAVSEHEGPKGFALGGGLSYYPIPKLKITSGIMGTNVFFSVSANIIFE